MDPTSLPVSMIVLGVTALYSLAAFGSPRLLASSALAPYEVVREGRWQQTLTSGLVHADLGHLFMNMFTLLSFGPAIERILGGAGFLIVYLVSLIAGSLLAVLRHHRDPRYHAVGASGAVSGVLFSYVLFRPFARIGIFMVPVGIPAALFALLYVAASIWGMKTRWGNIGHEAHLGGALAGVVATVLLEPAAVQIFLSYFS